MKTYNPDRYKVEHITQHGNVYRVEWVYDHDAGAPWDNSDCHGPVSDWTTRNKKPGERVLNQDRGSFRYYDFQQAVQDAVKVWGVKPGPDAVEAVEKDFQYLKDWCNDRWHYCGIIVAWVDPDAPVFVDSDISASLWGIESDCDGYHASIIQDLIGDCESLMNRRTYAGATVGA